MRKSIYSSATGQVVNVILLANDAEYTPPEGYALGPEAEIGDTVVNGEVVPQEVETPEPLPPSILDQLKAIFVSLPLEAQAGFGPVAAAVFMFLDQDNPAAAQLLITNTAVPDELIGLKTTMLGVFDD